MFNNDQDEMCMTKLKYIYSDFGYNIKLITPHIINILFGASDDSLSTRAFISLMIKKTKISVYQNVTRVLIYYFRVIIKPCIL